MSEYVKTDINDPEFKEVLSRNKNPIANYGQLAEVIYSSDKGTVIKFRGLKKNISNIKAGLERRNLEKDVNYKLNFKTDLDSDIQEREGTYFITVLGATSEV